ncbi:site-specific tyrosine recombinase XerC [Crateriforma conspicua]|nr:site-specific tyrosine recombinase XerC [Crateriforma conspicua]
MATIRKEPNGFKSILLVCPDKKRRTIRLGKMHLRTAEKVKTKIEGIAANFAAGVDLDPQQAEWLRSIDGKLHERIAKCGIIKPRLNTTLSAWLNRYMKTHDVKDSTKRSLERAKDNLIDYFGADRQIRTISSHHATEWRHWLKTEGNQRGSKKATKPLAENTVRRRTGRAKQFFDAAKRAGLIEANPFDGLKRTTTENKARQFFVEQDVIEQCIDHAPNQDWRTILALVRYAGIRAPSELVRLRWEDVNLPDRRLTIRATKTEHLSHNGVRVCPIFPELFTHLDQAWEAAPDGAEFVIQRAEYRQPGTNLGTTFRKIIERAGYAPWPKLFTNCRASRETELVDRYPIKDVSSWLGNSKPVAMKHYLMARDSVFARAIQEPTATLEKPTGTETGTAPSSKH